MQLLDAQTSYLRHQDLLSARICQLIASAHGKKGQRFTVKQFMYLRDDTPTRQREQRAPTGDEILAAFRAAGAVVIDKRNEG